MHNNKKIYTCNNEGVKLLSKHFLLDSLLSFISICFGVISESSSKMSWIMCLMLSAIPIFPWNPLIPSMHFIKPIIISWCSDDKQLLTLNLSMQAGEHLQTKYLWRIKCIDAISQWSEHFSFWLDGFLRWIETCAR